jgi:hypothetical protein
VFMLLWRQSVPVLYNFCGCRRGMNPQYSSMRPTGAVVVGRACGVLSLPERRPPS